jgi:DNA replication protein DnaC
VVIPARPRKPRDKAKVEKGVQVVEGWILAAIRNITFFGLHQLNGAIREKLDVLNNKPFQKMDGTRRSLYEQIDRPALRPLPETRYVFAEWRKATVNIDHHITVDHNLYSVPHSLIGRELDVRLTAKTVEVFNRGHRVAIHHRAFGRGRVTTEPSHRPSRCPPIETSGVQATSPRRTDKVLIEHTITRLNDMRPTGMGEAYSSQRKRPNIDELSFDERFSLMVDQEWTYRQNRRLACLLKAAKLRLPACVEDINYRQPRGLDRNLVVHLATCDWIRGSQNVLITGPTGVGKTFIACALAHSACRHGFSARCYRVPRLLPELAIARGDGSYPKMLVRLSKIRLLILDDWGTAPLSPVESRDILEIIDDRSQLSSTIIASQLPVEDWHASIIDPSVADAVLDRLVHNSHRIHLKGESMRKAEERS